jgi:hypothetical protein
VCSVALLMLRLIRGDGDVVVVCYYCLLLQGHQSHFVLDLTTYITVSRCRIVQSRDKFDGCNEFVLTGGIITLIIVSMCGSLPALCCACCLTSVQSFPVDSFTAYYEVRVQEFGFAGCLSLVTSLVLADGTQGKGECQSSAVRATHYKPQFQFTTFCISSLSSAPVPPWFEPVSSFKSRPTNAAASKSLRSVEMPQHDHAINHNVCASAVQLQRTSLNISSNK